MDCPLCRRHERGLVRGSSGGMSLGERGGDPDPGTFRPEPWLLDDINLHGCSLPGQRRELRRGFPRRPGERVRAVEARRGERGEGGARGSPDPPYQYLRMEPPAETLHRRMVPLRTRVRKARSRVYGCPVLPPARE